MTAAFPAEQANELKSELPHELSPQDLEQYNAQMRKKLNQFLTDLCTHTLNKAGYNHETYAFYLDIALRQQLISHQRQWDELFTLFCEAEQLNAKSHSNGVLFMLESDHQRFFTSATDYAQQVINNLLSAQQDNLAIKLIKNSYISSVAKAKKSSEAAYYYFNPDQIERSVCEIAGNTDDDKAELSNLLNAHVKYLNALANLPFQLQHIINYLKQNLGYNYSPVNEALLLSMTLDLVDQAFSESADANEQSVLTNGVKFILETLQPELSVDNETISYCIKSLLPFCQKLLTDYKVFDCYYNQFLSPKKTDVAQTQARRSLLSSLNVEFCGLSDLLNETLIEPAKEAAGMAKNLGLKASSIINGDIKLSISSSTALQAFVYFDQLAVMVEQQDQQLLPDWLQHANQYYCQFKKQAAGADQSARAALGGLGAFYNYAVSFIPTSVSNYFKQADDLQQLLGLSVNDEAGEVVLIYAAFFQLINDAKITGQELKEQLFDAYINDLLKVDALSNLEEKLNFAAFETFAYQIQNKASLDSSLTLSDRLKVIAEQQNNELMLQQAALQPQIDANQLPQNVIVPPEESDGLNASGDMTASLIHMVDEVNLQTPSQINRVLLVSHLQRLEQQFDIHNATETLQQIITALKAIDHDNQSHQVFNNKFLHPAFERLVNRYQQQFIIPVLEQILDSEEATSVSHHAQPLYNKLRAKEDWSKEDWGYFQRLITNVKKLKNSKQYNSFIKLMVDDNANQLKKNSIYAGPQFLTPNKRVQNSTLKTLKVITEPLIGAIQRLQDTSLSQQISECNKLKTLTSNTKIKELCDQKLAYINKLNQFISGLVIELQKPEKALASLDQFMNPKNHSIAKTIRSFNLTRFIVKSLPITLDYLDPNAKMNVTDLVTNILYQYAGSTRFNHLIQLENDYNSALECNPIPALMNELCNPLSFSRGGLIQEQIMDVIVAQLLSHVEQSTMDWGGHYLKQAASQITKEQLVKCLPYPLLAEFAMQVAGSQSVQDYLASAFENWVKYYANPLMGTLEQYKITCEAQIKAIVYPRFGINLQKTLEEQAYQFTLTRAPSNVERDAMALFYLKYIEIRKSKQVIEGQDRSDKDIIRFLFSRMLEDKGEAQQNAIVEAIYNGFQYVAEQLNSNINNIAEADDLLVFILKRIQNDTPESTLLMLTAIFNQQVLLQFKTKSTGLDQQVEAIDKLSELFAKIKTLDEQNANQASDDEIDGFDLIVSPKQRAVQALGEAHQQSEQVIRQHLLQTAESLKTVVSRRLGDCNQLLDKNSQYTLGYTIAEHKIRTSTWKNLIFRSGLNVLDFISFISLWSSTIGTLFSITSFGSALLAGVGMAALAGIGVTGFGLALMAAAFTARLTIKFIAQVYFNREQFRARKDERLFTKLFRRGKLAFSLLSAALFQTVFVDIFVEKTSQLLFTSPIKRFRNSLRRWPGRKKIEDEQQFLNRLSQENQTLINKITDSKTPLTVLHLKSNDISKDLDANKQTIKPITADARYSKSPDFAKDLKEITHLTTVMNQQVTQIGRIIEQKERIEVSVKHSVAADLSSSRQFDDEHSALNQSRALASKVIAEAPEPKPAVEVNIRDYIAHLNREQLEQGNFITARSKQAWDWIKGLFSSAPAKNNEELSSALLNSSFFMVDSVIPEENPSEVSGSLLNSSFFMVDSVISEENPSEVSGSLLNSSFFMVDSVISEENPSEVSGSLLNSSFCMVDSVIPEENPGEVSGSLLNSSFFMVDPVVEPEPPAPEQVIEPLDSDELSSVNEEDGDAESSEDSTLIDKQPENDQENKVAEDSADSQTALGSNGLFKKAGRVQPKPASSGYSIM